MADETLCPRHDVPYPGSIRPQSRIQGDEDATGRDDLVHRISSIPNEGSGGLSELGISVLPGMGGVGEWPKRWQGIPSPSWSNSAPQRSTNDSRTRSGVWYFQRIPTTSSIRSARPTHRYPKCTVHRLEVMPTPVDVTASREAR